MRSRLLLLSLLLAALGCHKPPAPQVDPSVAAVEALRGKVELDEAKADKPIVAVDFRGSGVTDADLKVLEKLAALQALNLAGTKVTDAGCASSMFPRRPSRTRAWNSSTG
jgi:hypothetical protein